MPPKLKKVFRPGESKTLKLKVTNRGSKRQPIHVSLQNVPDEWTVRLDREDFVLDGGADGLLDVSIRAPDKVEKTKVGMRLLTVPEHEPGKASEIWILAKLKPTRKQLKEAKNGGLFGGSSDDDTDADEVEEAAEDPPEPEPEATGSTPRAVVRTSTRAGPDPDRTVAYRYAPGMTAGGVYHVTHVGVGDGTVLELKEQVQLVCSLCSAQEICYDGKFHRYMDRETFLASDHCFLEEGDFD